jgi:hypothetical protein
LCGPQNACFTVYFFARILTCFTSIFINKQQTTDNRQQTTNSKTAKQQNRKTAKAKQQSSKTAKQQNSKTGGGNDPTMLTFAFDQVL